MNRGGGGDPRIAPGLFFRDRVAERAFTAVLLYGGRIPSWWSPRRFNAGLSEREKVSGLCQEPLRQKSLFGSWNLFLSGIFSCLESFLIQGIRPAKSKVELQLPAELLQAFATDPELEQAFSRLTPGRQKSYVLNLNSAKKPETKLSRIAQFRDKIHAGKGALER